VLENSDVDWSLSYMIFYNGLMITVSFDKNKEIVFRPLLVLPYPLVGIERVVSAKLLGVTFFYTVSFDKHVRNILTICNQRATAEGFPLIKYH